MCGIIAVLRRRTSRPTPARRDVEAALGAALAVDLALDPVRLHEELTRCGGELASADALLRGPAGLELLFAHPDLAARLECDLRALDERIGALENALDRGAAGFDTAELEAVNAALVRVRDASWAVHRDRLGAAAAIDDLTGDAERKRGVIEAYAAIQTALSSLDRLEVRGRDSAGLEVVVDGLARDWRPEGLAPRLADPLFRSGAVRRLRGGTSLAFVYKRSAEIGELGDNVAVLRGAIRGDALLRAAIATPGTEVTVLGHTRWASVGIISEPNAHPLDSLEVGRDGGPFVSAVLNGDVDNHHALVEAHGLCIAEEITTDAKVIPTLVARRLGEGLDRLEAFRRTVAEFEGSTAIGAAIEDAPGELMLALRGSGQALYVGCSEDAFVVASEPYGVVEECARYLRMDGETPGNPHNHAGSRGQIVRIRRDGAGTVAGLERIAFDGTPLPVADADLTRSTITTRDVDRGSYPHYLLKEISESPRSFRKTLRGKIVEDGRGRLRVQLGRSVLPDATCERLADGRIRRILTIGQGTAAVAAQGVAQALELALRGAPIAVKSLPATELSGFQMREDMSDTLIVAISQSGTTTDTNRTVDLARARGAQVVAIVNRRGSDLTDKADGVLFTSDGRDVEMSVASTKAFYAQIAAGFLLAFAVAQQVGCCDDRLQHELLTALRGLPDAMVDVLGRREVVRNAAQGCVRRRYWALVGNGSNLIAAREIRIKLSELCYKSIACDSTEDKKHIDLSSEPMILVCAAGLTGSTADDVAKEVAIYRAHKALPIVIADDGEDRFNAARAVIHVPQVHPELAFVLSTVAGHLFGYECALAIDALARPLRVARAAIEQHVQSGARGTELLDRLAPDLVAVTDAVHRELRDGRFDNTLEASTATRLTSLLRFATGIAPLALFQVEHGEVGTPATLLDSLTESLTRAIEELTRPVDAIKHQAKTVTVGISRSDESLLVEPLVREVLAAGVARNALNYADLRTLAALGPAVAQVVGFSRYEITGEEPELRIHQVHSGGVAAGLRSRTADDPRLRGTKHRVASERQVLLAEGRSDGRTVVFVPEVRGQRAVGITLLHVELEPHLSPTDARSVLSGYRNRYARLADAVMETEPSFDDALLAQVPTARLLTATEHELADLWRAARARRR
ncbi:MAG: SIS domain-containing protein [Planctomycetes bacterium]|nr:SIS domain-containing protein [Planctomycetota bacterium]